MQGPEEGVLPAAEGEVGDRRRDPDVDADVPDLGAVAELARGLAVLGEDRRRVAVGQAVDDGQRVVEMVYRDDPEDRSEDLLLRDGHVRAELVEDGRPGR